MGDLLDPLLDRLMLIARFISIPSCTILRSRKICMRHHRQNGLSRRHDLLWLRYEQVEEVCLVKGLHELEWECGKVARGVGGICMWIGGVSWAMGYGYE
jgi:hypothetical protein